jgi:hypothetical protein
MVRVFVIISRMQMPCHGVLRFKSLGFGARCRKKSRWRVAGSQRIFRDAEHSGGSRREPDYSGLRPGPAAAGALGIINFIQMDQAGRIIAGMKGAEGVTSSERIACAAWKRAVGKRLAGKTNAVKLVRDRLVVEVEDEIWRESLWKLRFQILRNIEKEIGTEIVAELQFVVAPPRKEAQRETGHVAAAQTAGVADAIDEADAIADPGLRRIYRNSRRKLTA